MNNVITAALMIMLTVGMYIAAKQLYKRFPSPFTLPVLIGTLLIIGVLEAGNIAYPVYMEGGRWIEYFLGPAVVSLAYPLYSQRKLLRRYFIPILCSSAVGAAAGTASGWSLSILVTNEQELLASVLPKSVTAPIAMSVAESLEGVAALAAVFVMIAGIGGVMMAPYIIKWFRITHPFARGMAMGSGAHAIGTAKALENSEEEGAASSVAMTVSAIIVSIIAPLLAFLVF